MEHLTPTSWVTEDGVPEPEVEYEQPSFLDESMVELATFVEIPQAVSDGAWVSKYGAAKDRLPFWATDEQTIKHFNSRNAVRHIVPLQENGFVLATWRDERTASVQLYPKTNTWCDFGANGVKSNGKKDGGDAFELARKVNGRGHAAQLRLAFDAMKSEAQELLNKGRTTGTVPRWLAEIVPPAKRKL